ncbi:hypothetical protein BaRGS_00000533 [Batillaria attramentaria]|uniref:Uncharacterized protein n=1 Tax=Batillaria attramentaria TaxID=370345 RepID=A0ABD0M8X5_9CAEN
MPEVLRLHNSCDCQLYVQKCPVYILKVFAGITPSGQFSQKRSVFSVRKTVTSSFLSGYTRWIFSLTVFLTSPQGLNSTTKSIHKPFFLTTEESMKTESRLKQFKMDGELRFIR